MKSSQRSFVFSAKQTKNRTAFVRKVAVVCKDI
jgi:hypothetical protein